MDIPAAKKPFKFKTPIFLFAGVFVIVIVWMIFQSDSQGWSANASTSVSHSEIMVATVNQEDFLVDVRAPGTLQPTSLRWIAATSQGRIEQLMMQPGARVSADTIIMQLSNPTLLRNVDSAKFALQVAEAERKALEKRLQSNYLAQEAVVNDFQARYQNATFRLEANNALSGLQIVSELDAKENKLQQQQLASRLEIEQKRLAQLADLHKAEVEASQARVDQARSFWLLQQELKDNLQVRAGLDGILQEIPVEQGQQVSGGAILARVAQEDKLKAELRVQESQVKDVTLGQVVKISAGGQHVMGEVVRIDPAVQNGVVIVDVGIPDAGLPGSRPDLRVTASIEIEKRPQVLTLRRPVSATMTAMQSMENDAHLYVVSSRDDTATLSKVILGRASLDKVHVIAGLQAGDKVIVSDTSVFADAPSINLD